MVARLVRNEKVGGSNPPSSTTNRHPIRMSVFCMPGCVGVVPRWCGAALSCRLWCRWCSGRRRARPPARLGGLTSFGAAPRSPPVPSGPSGAFHTGGAAPPSPTGTAAGPPVSSTPVGPSRLMVLGASARCPAAAWPVLLGRAAVCAGGRRPAREIATREPAARSGRSRSPARPCRRPRHPSWAARGWTVCMSGRRRGLTPGIMGGSNPAS